MTMTRGVASPWKIQIHWKVPCSFLMQILGIEKGQIACRTGDGPFVTWQMEVWSKSAAKVLTKDDIASTCLS